MELSRRCTGPCGEIKDIEDFETHERYRGGRMPQCKECRKKKREGTYGQTPGARRDYQLRTKYGITLSDYNRILESQGGGCGICGGQETRLSKWGTPMSLAVDHNHDTGEVRGILCHHHNQSVSFYETNLHLMEKVVAYLHRPPAREVLADDMTT